MPDIQIGGDTRFQVDTADSESSPTWVNLGTETSSTLTISGETVGADTKGNSGWGSNIAVLSRWNASVDGMLDRADAAYQYLQTKSLNRAKAHIRFNITNSTGGGGDGTFTGYGFIDSLENSFEVSNVGTFSVSINGDGQLVMA